MTIFAQMTAFPKIPASIKFGLVGVVIASFVGTSTATAQETVIEKDLNELLLSDGAPASPSPDASGADTGVEAKDIESSDLEPMQEVEKLAIGPVLRIGLMAERGASYLQTRIAPFRAYLQESLNRPVEIVAFSKIRSLISAHTSKQVDYAVYPSSAFAMAYASCGCLVPVVAPVSIKAPNGLYMVMVVRSQSGLNALADLTGKSLALSSKSGALPFHVALNELRRAGMSPDVDLAGLIQAGSPEKALKMLEEEKVDAALVWSTTNFNQTLLESAGAIPNYVASKKKRGRKAPPKPDFISIWQTRPIPVGAHAVHKDMAKQDRADLVAALKSMNKDAPDAYDALERSYGGGFKSVTLEDYDPLLAIATSKP